MVRTSLVVAAVVLVLVGGGLAYVSGFGPAPGGADETDDGSTFPTATPTPPPTDDGSGGDGTASTATDDGSGGDGTTSTATPTPQPFVVVIQQIEECGDTCRDVTVSLTNQQSEPATGVTVYTRVFAGNSTDDGDEIWRGSEDVGSLGAGETYTTTKRVELSFSEAFAVQNADGWVTVQTTIDTDDRRITFSEQRNVM